MFLCVHVHTVHNVYKIQEENEMKEYSSTFSNRKAWKKILYEKQDYPDNYTDQSTFLKDLRRNVGLRNIRLIEAVFGANILLQEFFTIVLFVLIYLTLINRDFNVSFIFNSFNLASLVALIFYRLRLKYCCSQRVSFSDDLRTILTFVAFGQLFSPILHTLTDTISTDTIYTMSFLMLLIHLVFFDFGINTAIVSRSLSLSAAIFASICLASRLSSANEAFVLLTIATQLFVIFPVFRQQLRHSFIFSVILCSLDLYFLLKISSTITVLFILCVLFINIICPYLFVRYQSYKDNIYGPWDEAIVNDIHS